MNLLIDIGNTRTKIKYETVQNIPSDPSFTVDDIVEQIGLFQILGVTEVEHVVISSVVPELTKTFIQYATDKLNVTPLVISPETSLIPVSEEAGADIISVVNAGVKETLVIMLGTATVFAYIKDHIFQGVVIAPGVKTGAKAIVDNAALIEEFEIEVPSEVLGQTSMESLQSGMVYGTASMIDGMIERISPTINCDIVAVGGFAEMIAPLCKYKIRVDQDLIFKGMLHILEKYEAE